MGFVEIVCIITAVFLAIWSVLFVINICSNIKAAKNENCYDILLLRILQITEERRFSGTNIKAIDVFDTYEYFVLRGGASEIELETYFDRVFPAEKTPCGDEINDNNLDAYSVFHSDSRA